MTTAYRTDLGRVGGDLAGDPRALLGHRVAHCTGRSPHEVARGYELVERVEQEAS